MATATTRPPFPKGTRVTREGFVATGAVQIEPARSGDWLVQVPTRFRRVARDPDGQIIDEQDETGITRLATTRDRVRAETMWQHFRHLGPLKFDGRAPGPLTAAEVDAFLGMPADVKRCLLYIATTRLATGQGPSVNRLWSVWQHGDDTRPAREGVDVVSRLDGRTRPSKADARHLLSYLAADWFVRFSPDPGSVKLRGLVYQLMRPQADALLRSVDLGPETRRYRGPKTVRPVDEPAES